MVVGSGPAILILGWLLLRSSPETQVLATPLVQVPSSLYLRHMSSVSNDFVDVVTLFKTNLRLNVCFY